VTNWLVDGMNLLGSRPDGWWRDRRGARQRLVDELAQFRERTGDRVDVVFDGRHVAEEVAEATARSVGLRFAPGGPDAADDVIAALVEGLDGPDAADTTVVTSDQHLAGRVRAAGGSVLGVSAFRRLLEPDAR
jgi:predicted RNA-binding protein with PIN domain